MDYNESVKEYISENEKTLTVKKHPKYEDLSIVKYKSSVFWNSAWDQFNVDLRGTVIDTECNPVSIPFRKVFNRGEASWDFQPDEQVLAVDKVNGFMAAVSYCPEKDDLIVTTTGSFTGPFVERIKSKMDLVHIYKWFKKNPNNWDFFDQTYTLIFEICHEDDPHIIEEEFGIYLIGARKKSWALRYDLNRMSRIIEIEMKLDKLAKILGVKRPKEWKVTQYSSLIEELKTCKREGFMVYGESVDFNNQRCLKLKSPYYLVNKLLARMKEDKFNERLNNGSLKQMIDEEFYPLLDYVKNIPDFTNMDEYKRLEIMKEFINGT